VKKEPCIPQVAHNLPRILSYYKNRSRKNISESKINTLFPEERKNSMLQVTIKKRCTWIRKWGGQVMRVMHIIH
jgi:hypothetical protein